MVCRLGNKMSERSDMPIVFPAPLPEEHAKGGGPERRAQVRYPFTAAAEVYDLGSQTRVTGRCSDLGPGGCYVDTLSPLVVGAVVKVRIERDMREFEASAVVLRARRDPLTERLDLVRGELHHVWRGHLRAAVHRR